MSWKLVRPAVLFLSVVALTAMTTGCAEERDPINRVQPDALAKSFFVGADLASDADNPDFYANGTLLDIGYGAAQSGLFSAFYSNDLTIIRWQITEDLLIGRLGFERINNADGKGAGKETNDGQVIYVFRILKHFDIRHAYNPSTGEELNVIEENASDRAWYQREYMRVDWSQNLSTHGFDFDTNAVYGALFGVEYEPIAYYVNDPSHPHAPNFEPDDGYFDITTKSYAKPAMVDTSHLSWGYDDPLPACWFDADFSGGTYPAGNCNPHEVTIRHSFWKTPDRDYEAADWDGFRFQAFGAFTKDRFGMARNYGMTDTNWHRFISRYNIWQRSHYYENPDAMTGPVECFTPETTPVGASPTRDDGLSGGTGLNGTHDECEAVGNGSRCNTFTQKCTLPYAQRETRPIVWYYTQSSDQRWFEPTVWATRDFDAAMRIAVQAARNAECYRIGGTDCDVSFPVPHGQMTQSRDAVDLIHEVDTCLRDQGTWDTSKCTGVIEPELQERGYLPGTEDYLALYTIAAMDRMIVLCHSPTQADDHPLCTPGKPRLPSGVTAQDCEEARAEGGNKDTRRTCEAAYAVRIGDVRRHLINVIQSPESPSPWGFGPTYANPLTGEAIAASINLWSWPTERIAQATLDQARFIAGELSVEDVTDGVYVRDWAEAANLAKKGGALGTMTRGQYDAKIRNAVRATSTDLETGDAADVQTGISGSGQINQIPAKVKDAIHESVKYRAIEASADAPTTQSADYIARMQRAQGTATEAALITKAMMQFAGADNVPTEMATHMSSPLRGNVNPTLRRELKHFKENALAERGACMLMEEDFAPSPTAMVGLSNVLQQKFGAFNPNDDTATQLARADKMKRYLADKMHYAVIVHEMGHTFGYRHNFVSSSSAINYRPQYWQLRTRNGQVTDVCTDLTNSDDEAANCVGPRYYDAVTQNETDNMIDMFSHSSVMDYAGDYTQDMLGLGAYDFAAARMFYGETATVFADSDLVEGTPLSGAITDTIMDNFGGIVGYKYQSAPVNFQANTINAIHYSELNSTYGLINNCQPITPEAFKPSNYDEELYGEWSPLLDGLIVTVDGQASRCNQRRVAYVHWEELRESGVTNYRAPLAIDRSGRTRVPYAFATDRWADLGNLSVYRHDNGADAYEIFNFFVTEQELRHIFDNFRRDRQGFSVRNAANRILNRYNTKMRDGAKGIGLISNNIRALGQENGLIPETYFEALVEFWDWKDNMLAAGLAFDHFARQMQRPQPGGHSDPSINPPNDLNPNAQVPLRWENDPADGVVIISDGPQGYYSNVGFGGKQINNDLADNKGEYDSQFTINAGSYYDKVYTAMLLTESVDNFISSDREDFVDPRGRAVSIADLFSDGYRRWLSSNLTNDDFLKGARVPADALGNVVTDNEKYPGQPMGWTSWWTETPELCFPSDGTTVCSAYSFDGTTFEPNMPAGTRPLDSQIGWEQQKFLIADTLVYLPSNQKQTWLDMMGIWSLGDDTDPGFNNRIELHMPSGDVYIARTYGSEQICFEQCVTVQRGIGARILEYANTLLEAAYVTTPVTQNGVTWYVPVIGTDGKALVKYDAGLQWLNPNFTGASPPADCNTTDNTGCECEHNGACMALEDYISVPDFMRQAMRDFGLADPTMLGLY